MMAHVGDVVVVLWHGYEHRTIVLSSLSEVKPCLTYHLGCLSLDEQQTAGIWIGCVAKECFIHSWAQASESRIDWLVKGRVHYQLLKEWIA